jgi:uncharacterized damage-inducible protein DinB
VVVMTVTDAILETWRRNTEVLTNILQALPEGGIDAMDTGGKWTVAHHLADMQGATLEWLKASAPSFVVGLEELYFDDPSSSAGWGAERDVPKIIAAFQASSVAVENAVRHHLETNEAFGEVYAHPIFFLQHMIWHQAYHMGQIVWALKQSEMRFSDEQTFEMIWKVLRK